jgi:hypothetical protein
MSEYCNERSRRNRKRIFWGLLLIGAGCVFLLDRMDIVDIEEIWHYWPLVISLSGLVDILSASKFKHITNGFFEMVLGVWLYASIENLWGLTFGTSWPILLIAYGASIAAEGVANHFGNSKKETTQ